MENIFVEFLPPWVETGIQPAFYDKESGTVLQQTARMYARVNMLIRMFNKLSKNTKETVEEYITKFNELYTYVHDYFDNLDVQDEINHKLDEMVEDGTMEELISHYFAVSRDITPLGTNLLDGATWNIGTGWSGDAGVGFTHTSGNTATLTTTITVTPNELYLLKFTCTNQSAQQTNNVTAQFGNSPVFDQYYDDGTVTKYLSFYPEDGDLVFTPDNSWNGTITNVAIYKIETTDKIDQTMQIYDTEDNVSFALTITKSGLNNTIIGKGAMQYATAGSHNNVAVGNNVLERTASGYYNTAVGSYALQNSIQGTRNVAVGFNALNGITYGDRNVGVGSFALHKVTSGKNNIGIGADSAWYTTTGSNNIAISNGALSNNTTGQGNISLGYFSQGGNISGSNNIALGYLAGSYNQTGNGNISLGYFAHYKGIADGQDVAIGHQAMSDHAATGNFGHNVAIGYQAYYKSNGSENVVIGSGSLKEPTNESNYNVVIGADNMSQTVTSAGSNIVIGRSSGRNIAGTSNIALGHGALNGACTYDNVAIGGSSLSATTGKRNIGIGLNSGKNITSGESNICIGANSGTSITTGSNQIIIGNNLNGSNTDDLIQIGTCIAGVGSKIGLGGTWNGTNCAVNFPAGTNSVAPLRLNSGTLLSTPGNGCIEFDGSHLYITINNARQTII